MKTTDKIFLNKCFHYRYGRHHASVKCAGAHSAFPVPTCILPYPLELLSMTRSEINRGAAQCPHSRTARLLGQTRYTCFTQTLSYDNGGRTKDKPALEKLRCHWAGGANNWIFLTLKITS